MYKENLTDIFIRLNNIHLIVFKCFVILVILWPTFACADAGRGYVELVQYDESKQILKLSGWAAPNSPNVYTSTVVISVGDKKIYRGRFLRSVRPDVVKSTQRTDWLWSGWSLEVNATNLMPGSHDVRVKFILTDGDDFDVLHAEVGNKIKVPKKDTPDLKRILFLMLAIALPVFSFLFSKTINHALSNRWTPATIFFASVVSSFFLLVGSGFTGSSVRLAFKDSPILDNNAIEWQGKARFIRMDEWNILTQMAIGQTNVIPKFPILNKNVGIDGNNMLMIGMTGVPVSHLSALAKPATWGFWAFNLQKALAWHWWFPFFACFIVLWAFLIRLFGLDWKVASVLAITIPASSYSVVFSGHPAYTVFFPILSLLLLDSILRNKKLAITVFLGALLGLSVAGFILVLYLPWQITLIYLIIPVGIVHFLYRKDEFIFRKEQIIAIFLAIVVALVLIGSWLIDTQDVLRIISDTVYPGQRATSVGGDIDPWFMVKGMISPMSIYHETPLMNASDAGSFIWLWLPLLIVSGLICWEERKLHYMPVAIIGFGVLALTYMYIGFPKYVAELTAWGRVTSYRLDVSLGLAQLMLMGWLFSMKNNATIDNGVFNLSLISIGVGFVITFWSIWLFGILPVQVAEILTPGYVLLFSCLLGFMSCLLIDRHFKLVVYIYAVLMVGAAWSFNPIDLAPKIVNADKALLREIRSEGLENSQVRIAVLDMHQWRMNLVSAGLPVANAILYYPQPSLWKNLDPNGNSKNIYNRYQNLEFTSHDLHDQITFQIDSPQLDLVTVTIDPKRFDFRKLEVTHVLTSPRNALVLQSNNSLQQIVKNERWLLFKVKQ